MIFAFRPSTHSKYNMCSVLAFFHYRENFNLISFAPLLGYLTSFFQIQKAKLRQKMVFRVPKARFVVICEQQQQYSSRGWGR